LMQYVMTDDNIDMCQFGFKQGHSTSMCANVLKRLKV
jgi:hypothetical protein